MEKEIVANDYQWPEMDWEREYDAHDPINGVDLGPCPEFAPDTLGDTPDVCIRCFYNRVDHK